MNERAEGSAESAEQLLQRWLDRGDDVDAVWKQTEPGPAVDAVASRISGIPKSFLDDRVALVALAGDILGADRGRTAASTEVVQLLADVTSTGSSAARRGAAIALWIWASEGLSGTLSPRLDTTHAARTLAALALRLAAVVDPSEWISDAERRDEAARTFLLWSGQLPATEDRTTARSLLDMRDSLQHNGALAAAAAEHAHRLEVTRALNDARAREAAARYTHE
ncbi:phosphohydrolase [Agreia sp.]|uniref:phosphohydrolase n=1 Tax=Agreia sp. TaxID=1872416 RepID=UPI0035BBECA7